MSHYPPIVLENDPPFSRNRILVTGGSERALDLLRLATIRSDDVVLIDPKPDPSVKRFAQRFAIKIINRTLHEADLPGAAVVLVAIGDAEAENHVVRLARRFRVPVYVADRTLVSDFEMLAFLEQRPLSALAA